MLIIVWKHHVVIHSSSIHNIVCIYYVALIYITTAYIIIVL